jgi:AraC family transcriptional regulator
MKDLKRIEPIIKSLEETRVVGKKSHMSLKHNTTVQLWREFMPLRRHITDPLDASFWSVEVYPGPDFFKSFDPAREFEKWAAVPVGPSAIIPEDLQVLLIPSGLYAVFSYKGKESEVSQMYGYIYGAWIPKSGYTLDHRPHFAVMGAKYKGEHPDSEEELWIPIKEKPTA